MFCLKKWIKRFSVNVRLFLHIVTSRLVGGSEKARGVGY